jgi:TonB family protein
MRGLCWMFALLSLRAAAQTPLEKIAPDYSDEARLAGLEGTVQVSVTVADDGTTGNLEIAQPLGLGLDQKALEAAKQWRFQPGVHLAPLKIGVEFLLPAKQSRWHLTNVAFDLPEGAARPTFLSAKYPLGSGLALDVKPSAIDEARILAVVGRQAWAIVVFDVDEKGVPRNFEAPKVSADVWRNQAIALVRAWRFTPGKKDGKPIQVHCTLSLVWGKRNLSVTELAQAVYLHGPEEPAPRPSQFHPPAPGVARVAVSASMQAARLIHGVAPEFSSAAWQTGLGGKIYIEVLIGTDGHVQEALPVIRRSEFIPLVTKALTQWVYQPTTVNGIPAEVTTMVSIEVPLHEAK